MSRRAAPQPSDPARQRFAAEARAHLLRTPRQLPSQYFYDDLGSALFEAIGRLPWYRVTRAEEALLARHARDILRPLRRPVGLAELGCGSGEKLAILAGRSGERVARVQLVDISPAALDMARYRLHAIGCHDVLGHQGTYEDGLAEVARHRREGEALVILFLGSNIGNFDPAAAHRLLSTIRGVLRSGDALLLGSDLVKPEAELILAYDDPLGVTAAFNRNILRRLNEELDADFDLAAFAHRAVWRPERRRVEMHLVSRRRQNVLIGAAGFSMTLEAGEVIWTESSHKYDTSQIIEDGRAAGFDQATQWVDSAARFALTRFLVNQ